MRNPGACRSYAEVAVDGIPVCQQHADSTLESRRLAGLESPCVTVHDTGFCQYDRVYARVVRDVEESGRDGTWDYRVEMRPPRRSDLVRSAYFTVTAGSEREATAGLRIPAGWTVYVNRVRRVSRV